jgi:hypothetical protein
VSGFHLTSPDHVAHRNDLPLKNGFFCGRSIYWKTAGFPLCFLSYGGTREAGVTLGSFMAGVQFVLGRGGTSETRRCVHAICDTLVAGGDEPLILPAPEQAARYVFEATGAFICRSPVSFGDFVEVG